MSLTLRWSVPLLFLVTIGVFCSGSNLALSQDSEKSAFVPGRILVKPEAGVSQVSVERVEGLKGASVEEELPLVDVLVVDLPAGVSVSEATRLYEGSPNVEYAEPDYLISTAQSCPPPDPDEPETEDPGDISTECIDPAPDEPPPDDPPSDVAIQAVGPQMSGTVPVIPNDPYFSQKWGLNNTGQAVNGKPPGAYDADIDATEAWSVGTGSPDTVVAVLDSGVDINHPDLRNNIWVNPDEIPDNSVDDDGNGYVDDVNGWDFINDDNTVYDSPSSDEHGTHVAGIIAAEGNNGIGATGVAWRARIMPLKFISGSSGSVSNAIDALGYAVAEGAKISNNSWLCNTCPSDLALNQSLYDAINAANTSEHLFVNAAGNRRVDQSPDSDVTPRYPAGYDLPNILPVAATDQHDVLAGFSNYGATSVDLAAPGVDVYSTLPGGYGFRDGTSMATPHVAGVAALLKSTSPELNHLQIKDRILESAERKTTLSGKVATGGRINAATTLGIKFTELSVSASPTLLTYGSGTTISGKLTSFGEPVSGKQVILEKRPAGETDFTPFATAITASDGAFSHSYSYPDRHSDYRARFAGEQDTGFEPSTSSVAAVNVRVGVTLSVSAANLKLGRARGISGYVSPNHAGDTVIVLVKRGSDTITRKTLTLDADSRYRWIYKPSKAGNYRFAVTYAGDPDHFGNTSPSKGYKVLD